MSEKKSFLKNEGKGLEDGGESSDDGWCRDIGAREAEVEVEVAGTRNWYTRGTVHVRCLEDKARLRWFGPMLRRESEY